jgi:serine/threonine-protein kinase
LPAVPELSRDPLRDQLQATLGTTYSLTRELGGGGMSRVYVAREEALGRDVVVKMLAPELAEGLSAERFAREIKLAAALQEPHIVPVLAAGVTAEGLPWYTMPYVRGESLRARLVQGPVPLAEAVAILRDVATALDYAHGQHLVHRDIKPENVLLSGRTAVVTDFGIAKALQASRTQAPGGSGYGARTAALTQLGTSLGTPAYMAPEQAAGDSATDHRADLYAWGVVAYELLAGRHPFAGKTSPQALMAAHFAETPAPLPTPPVPAGLAALVARCLAKDPADRPASAADVLATVDGASTGAHPGAQSGTPAHATASRRRRTLAGAAVAVLALAGGAAAWRARAAGAGTGPAGDGTDAPPLVAVLPFEVAAGAGGVPADSAFADGLGDAITGKLARLAGLRVIDRASVRSVEGAAARPQAAGRTLGADYVLRATLRWARGADGQPRVQVSPVLVRVSDGTTRWAGEPSVVAPADAFTVQGVLATEVAEALDVALAPAERTRLAAPASRDTAAFAAIERGQRIRDASDSLAYPERLRRALAEYEFAYRRDPESAEAWGGASYVLQHMGNFDGSPALTDSAAGLARRALALDAGNLDAVHTLAFDEQIHGRVPASRAVVARAVQAHPSSAELRMLLAAAAYTTGDTAPAWPAALAALQLAPRSTLVVREGIRVARGLRRAADAGELVARLRALDPAAPQAELMAGVVAVYVGDSVAAGRALRAYEAKGGRFVASGEAFRLMRFGHRAMGDALLAGTPAAFGARSSEDTMNVYGGQATLLLRRGDAARTQPLLARGLAIVRRLSDGASPDLRAQLAPTLAWFAAATGDRATADRALAVFATTYAARLRGAPGGLDDARLTCTGAEVAGLLGDVAAMLAPLRRCLTMPNGYGLAALRNEPGFSRHAADPRVRALAQELAAAEQRARTTPVQPAR